MCLLWLHCSAITQRPPDASITQDTTLVFAVIYINSVSISERAHKQATGCLKTDTILWVLLGFAGPRQLVSREHYSRDTGRPDEFLKVGGTIRGGQRGARLWEELKEKN